MNGLSATLRDTMRLIGHAFTVYRRDPATLLPVGLLMFPMQLISGIVAQRVNGFQNQQNTLGWFLIPFFVVQFIAVASASRAVTTILGGDRSSFFDALDATFERFGDVLRTVFHLLGLLVASAFAAPALAIYWLFNRTATIDGRRNWILALVPLSLFVYLYIRWIFAPQAVVLEGRRDWDALDASANIVRDHWWRSAATMFAGALVVFLIGNLSGPAIYLPELAYVVIVGLVLAAAAPIYFIAQTLLYYDLKARKQDDVSAARLPPAEPDLPGEGA